MLKTYLKLNRLYESYSDSLYHITAIDTLPTILSSNSLKIFKRRERTLFSGKLQFEKSLANGNPAAILVLDQTKLKMDQYEFYPAIIEKDYEVKFSKIQSTVDKDITNLNKYLIKIIIVNVTEEKTKKTLEELFSSYNIPVEYK